MNHDQDLSEHLKTFCTIKIYETELPSSDETSIATEDFESSSQQTCENDLDYQPEIECESSGPPAKKPKTRSSYQDTNENVSDSSSHDSDVDQDEPGIFNADDNHAGFFLPLFASLHKL